MATEIDTPDPAAASIPVTTGLRWINVAVFVALLCVGGILFWTSPRQTISRDEKRPLAQMPALTFGSVFDGSYERKTDNFYNDHFPGRDSWIDIATRLKRLRGFVGEDVQVFTRSGPAPGKAPNAPPDEQFTPSDDEYRTIRAVAVVNGAAVQMFAGSKATLGAFVDMIGKYRQELPGVKIYVLSIPVGADLYLPRQVNNGVMREKVNIDLLYSQLPPDVIPVHAYEEILPHRHEYIQFRTDHHWTGRGAYYAYRAFARAAGFTPLELSQMTYGRIKGDFVGSLYYYTRSPDLKPDYVEYWKIPGTTKVTVFRKGFEKGFESSLYVESAHGGNSYGVFIGGDLPLLRIETGLKTGRKILIIKDSFGNALAPYLAAHYDEVFVIDYRSFKGNIPQLMQFYGINELLYAHNTFAINSKVSATRGIAMLEHGQR